MSFSVKHESCVWNRFVTGGLIVLAIFFGVVFTISFFYHNGVLCFIFFVLTAISFTVGVGYGYNKSVFKPDLDI